MTPEQIDALEKLNSCPGRCDDIHYHFVQTAICFLRKGLPDHALNVLIMDSDKFGFHNEDATKIKQFIAANWPEYKNHYDEQAERWGWEPFYNR